MMSAKFDNKLVAVTQRIDFVTSRNEYRESVDQKLIHWLASSGFLPVCVPNGLFYDNNCVDKLKLENWLYEVRPTRVLLSGGNDIGQYPYRDETEAHLLSWSEQRDIPVLGICRGMQMMAVWAGGSLYRSSKHVGVRHRLIHNRNVGCLPHTVNSYHEWSVKSCPLKFELLAHAEDGTIEAVRHIEMPWEGWMWHPEREAKINPVDTERMKRLFGEK